MHQTSDGATASNSSRIGQRIVYRALVATASHTRYGLSRRVWDRLWPVLTSRMTGTTQLRIHGVLTSLNTGHAYPAFSRRWPAYNSPLVHLVQHVRDLVGPDLVIVDVGASIGDTVLLIMETAPGSHDAYICFEPDPEFFHHLRLNLGGLSNVELRDEMLADGAETVATLIRTHSGTASAQGDERRSATTLDQALIDRARIDVLKVDTDGFDGVVLAGALGTLRQHRPHVIFEWHPLLLQQTGQELLQAFEVLVRCDYQWFVWFTKEGNFSHIDHGFDEDAVRALAQLCITGAGPSPDWHYDVVAIPRFSGLGPVDLVGRPPAG